jgi:hypothetical protein
MRRTKLDSQAPVYMIAFNFIHLKGIQQKIKIKRNKNNQSDNQNLNNWEKVTVVTINF